MTQNPLMKGAEARAYASRKGGGNYHAFPVMLYGDYMSTPRNAFKQIKYHYGS